MMNGNGGGYRKNFVPGDRPFYNGKFNNGPRKSITESSNKLPSAADFPSLNGRTSVTPPATAINGNANGMTAAQVLKRPAPGAVTPPAATGLEESMAGLKVTKEERPESPDLPAPVFPSISDPPTSRAIAAA